MFYEIPAKQRYGYIRVSSKSQEGNFSLEWQKEELRKYQIPDENIRVEIGSAEKAIRDKPILQHLIYDELKTDHLLIVTKIDQCTQNTLEFLKLQRDLSEKGVYFISLDLPYSSDLSVNRIIAANLAAIATFESERRKERQMKGIEVAKKAGKYKGRKTIITSRFIKEVQKLKYEKQLPITEIARLTGKSRSTIYKVLKEHLGYVSNQLVKSGPEDNSRVF